MKTLTAKLSLALGAVCLLGFSLQAGSYSTAVTIPFGFQTTTHVLPAGTYNIHRSGNDSYVRLREVKTGKGVFLQVGHDSPAEGKHGVLVFHRYGDEYFLSEIWPPAGAGTMVMPNRHEKDLQRGSREGRNMATISLPFRPVAD